jgi:hypothetical protein
MKLPNKNVVFFSEKKSNLCRVKRHEEIKKQNY